MPTTGFIYEWEHDIEESVDKLFNGCPIDYSHAFQVPLSSSFLLELFLPVSSLHRPVVSLLFFSVAPNASFSPTPSAAWVERFFPRAIRSNKPFLTLFPLLVPFFHFFHSEPLTHIITQYLKPTQRNRLLHALHSLTPFILSTNWVYACIDHYSRLPENSTSPWDALLFKPTPLYTFSHHHMESIHLRHAYLRHQHYRILPRFLAIARNAQECHRCSWGMLSRSALSRRHHASPLSLRQWRKSGGSGAVGRSAVVAGGVGVDFAARGEAGRRGRFSRGERGGFDIDGR